jgi:hypothetical protein
MHLGAGRAEIMAMPTTLEETRAAHERRFRRLAATWKAETELVSKVTKRILHPAYQKIIGMGEPAIPLILKDLSEHGPDDWFWALTAITDDNPITEDISGDMQAMAEAWLQWGRKAGYLSDSPSPSNGSSQT